MPARTIFNFADWNRNHPGEPLPGDRLDAQFYEVLRAISELSARIDKVLRSDDQLQNGIVTYDTLSPDLAANSNRRPRAVSTTTAGLASASEGPQVLGPNAGGPYAMYTADSLGGTAVAADYAQVSIDWAEHMPDTIPPNTLAVMGITGNHWSSRWWASHAAAIVAGGSGSLPAGVNSRQMRQALVALGGNAIYTVDSVIPADIANAVNMEWNSGQSIVQGDPLSFVIQTQLGYNDAQMTALFASAATYPK